MYFRFLLLYLYKLPLSLNSELPKWNICGTCITSGYHFAVLGYYAGYKFSAFLWWWLGVVTHTYAKFTYMRFSRNLQFNHCYWSSG